MSPDRHIDRTAIDVALLAALATLFALAVWSTGCHGTIDGARKTVTVAARLQIEAAKALVDFDKTHQMNIVNEARSSGDTAKAQAVLADYRSKRDAAVTAMSTLWSSTQVAVATIAAVEQGIKPEKDLQTIMASVLSALGAVKGALVNLGVPLGGVP